VEFLLGKEGTAFEAGKIRIDFDTNAEEMM
jgi:hypothetical protein